MNKIIAIIAGFLIAQSTLAASIGVNPSALAVNQTNAAASQSRIIVYNTGDTPAIYEVYPDHFAEQIAVSQSKFRLEAGDARELSVFFERLPVGNTATAISIVAQDISARDGDPKVGVKIPVDLQIRELAPANQSVFSYILVLLIIIFVVAALWFLQKRKFSKGLIALVFIVAAALLIWSLTSRKSEQNQAIVTNIGQVIDVQIQEPEKSTNYQLPLTQEPETAFSALRKIADQYSITMQFNPPNDMGVFVTRIGDYENGDEGKYWMFEVNNEQIPVAADKHTLAGGETLLWKFDKPN